MAKAEKPTPGRIVNFIPGKTDSEINLPAGTESTPAMVVKVDEDGIKLNVFGCEGDQAVQTVHAVVHKDDADPGAHSWEWPKKS